MKSKIKKTLNQMIAIGAWLYVVTLILEKELNGTIYTVVVWGGILFIWGFLYAQRTGLKTFQLVGVLAGSALWHYFLVRGVDTPLTMGTWILHMAIIAAVLFVYVSDRIDNHQYLEKNAFRLFQMAVKNIWDTSNGFTKRPYTAGKLSFSREELNRFVGYLTERNIIKPIVEEDKVFLTFSMNISPVTNPPIDQLSYVLFDYSGNVSVNISEKDYKQFTAEYKFDQLCASIGELFKDFYQDHKAGNEYKIISRLKNR